MELYQLEAFLAVAKDKGFSRAAERLHKTQPAISQAVSKLEEELGEILFDRSKRDGTLTDAGRLLVHYAEELLNVRSSAKQALTELRQLHMGKLAVAANEFTSLYLLPILEQYVRLHPGVKVEIKRTLGSEITGYVQNQGIEFGLVSFDPADSMLTSTLIFRDTLEFVAPPQHPFARVPSVSIRELGAQEFVAHNVVSPYRNKVVETFRRCNTPLRISVELPTIESIKRFVAAGHGVAIVPRIAVAPELARGELVSIPVKELRFERKIRLIYRKGANLSHAGVAFLRLCRSMAESKNGSVLFQSEKLKRRMPVDQLS
jgi:DNA-binding transcriptional LysR family regulator